MDAIDAVLATIDEQSFSIIATASVDIPESARNEIRALCSPTNNEIYRAHSLGIELSQLTASLVSRLLTSQNYSYKEISAIGFHGQTIRHFPNASPGFSIQIGCPSTLAHLSKITTIADFRMADIAAGGQGAPLVPAFHQHAFQTNLENRYIVNIGGIANLSFLPMESSQPILGFDTGPGNTLLDEWIYKYKKLTFDKNGEWARSGNLITTLLEKLTQDSFICASHPKSTGKEHFNLEWLAKMSHSPQAIKPEDMQRTLVELSCYGIEQSIRDIHEQCAHQPARIYLCGGGVNNTLLTEVLKARLQEFTILSTAALGIDPQLVEASAFAWLARQTLHRKPGNISSVTGAKEHKILGGIFPA